MSLRYEQHYIQNPHVFGSLNKYAASPNFHERTKNQPASLDNNFMISRNSGPQTYPSVNLSNSINQLPNDSKVSHARNFKQRLYQADQLQQAKKQIQKISYRQELQQQMKANKQRKQREKQKVERQELERERKFYAQVGIIKAQQPKPKQEPSYMILRSRKGDRKKQKTERNLNSVNQSRSLHNKINPEPVPELHMPKIMRRGGYHNQSSLDSISPSEPNQQVLTNQSRVQNAQTSRISPFPNRSAQLQEREVQIMRERNYEEERISSIIKLQQKTIKKLEYFRQQIIRSNNQFNTDKQVQQIRNILRSKPIKLQVWGVKNDQIFNNNNDFYQFPKSDPRIMARSRNRHDRSTINQGIDLNIRQQEEQSSELPRTFTAQDQQQNEQKGQSLTSRKRKREIKLFKSSNDKNYAQPIEQTQQNPQINNIPVVLRQQHKGKNRQQQQDDNN